MMNAALGDILNDRKAVRRWGIGGLMVIALVVLFFSMFGDQEQKRTARRAQFVEVKRILSGHTVKLESDQRLTYAGIRTPHKGEPLFEEARRRNADLVEGKEVRLRFDKRDRDGKNRMLAYVYTDAGFVNEALVREGLAYVRLTPETRRFADLLLAAQAEAQEHKRGLWGQPSRSPEPRYPADPKYGNFHRPACEEVPKIKPARVVSFTSRTGALDAGYAPCSKCLP